MRSMKFVATLLLLLGILQEACLRTSVQAQAYGCQQTNSQTEHNSVIPSGFTKQEGVRYIPSPFSNTKSFLPNQGPLLPTKPEDFEGRLETERQIVFETLFISASVDHINKLLSAVDTSKFQSTSAAINPQDVQDFFDQTRPTETGSRSRTATIKNLPAIYGQISFEQLELLKEAVKRDARINIAQQPTMTAFENQAGSVTDAVLRPFVVDIDTIVGDFAKAHTPVIQCIEEGTILNIKGAKIGDGIRIQSQVIFNQIVAVDVIKIDSSQEDGPSIQVPTCKMKQVGIVADIQEGNCLLIDPNIVSEVKERVERGVPMLSNIPYVGRVMKNHTIEEVNHKTLVVLIARSIEPNASK